MLETVIEFFISNAMAQAPAGSAAAQEPGFMGFLPLIIIFVLFYFLLIRPQSKRSKEHKQMVAALDKGDELVTNGGILGKATEVGESFITMEIADGVSVQVQRQSISTLVPKGTYLGKKEGKDNQRKKESKKESNKEN